MKSVFALLLAICLVVGLGACSRTTENPAMETENTTVVVEQTQIPMTTEVSEPTESPEPADTTVITTVLTTVPTVTATTKATESTTLPTTAATVTDPIKPDPADSPFNGKTIEIYGLGFDTSYTDYSVYDGEFAWMMRAAVVEWAEINGVNLVFSGDYDQNEILSAISGGNTPDVIFHTDKFPAIANADIITSFTDTEHKKLAEVCGSGYLEMLNYRTKSYGFVLPWAGNTVCYYNKTLFENYGVKTPKEYFMEGEWTWENFLKCMEEMTMDTDGDGETDIYGLPGDSLSCCSMVNPIKTDATGKLANAIDDPMIQAFFQFKYDAFTVKKCALPSVNNIQTNIDTPMFAMQMSGCEPYKFEQLYQSLPNGNELEVVPVPAYEDRNLLQWTQACVSLASACDERAAAVDMLAYLLKCGMKYVSDCSLGVVKCEYEGIQGFSTLSAEFVRVFTAFCESRVPDSRYDETLITKIYESFRSADWYTYQTYTGVTQLTSYGEITQMPPESAIPQIKPKYEAEIQKYNDTYISE